MGDYYMRPYPYKINRGDFFLVYAAFQRSIHHFNYLQDAPESEKKKFYSEYKDIFTHVKPFTQDSQNIHHDSIFEYLFGYMKNLFVTNQDIKDLKYSEESEEWEQEFNNQVEKFPTLSNVSHAHVHALDAHYVTDITSYLPHKEDFLNFDKNQIIHPFDECREWMCSPLKEALMRIPSKERLRWCVRLLAAYHYESECSMFMSSAFKFCLRAVNLSPIAECRSAKAVHQTIIWYFDFFRNFLTEAVPYRSKFVDRCTDFLFYISKKNFRILLEYGASYGYSQERLAELKWWIVADMRGMGLILSKEGISQRCEYYCLQVFYLYFYIRKRRYGVQAEEMLQAIWLSISEPFITKDDILASFFHMANNGGFEFWRLSPMSISDFAKKVYQWYCDTVATTEEEIKSPRCLRHLSRCAIRSHLRFPINVDPLDLPQTLKDYLMLREL